MVSEVYKNYLFCPYNPAKIRNAFMFVSLLVFYIVFAFFPKSSFVDPSAFYWQIWDHIFKTVFPKDFCLFCNLHSKMSRHMSKWRHKVCNGPILPPWNLNFQNYFFQSLFMNSLSHFVTNPTPYNQNSFFYTISLVFYSKLQDI